MANLGEKLRDFRATKGVLVWSCLGTAVLTMVVGFTWGGWVTGGSAEQRAEEAAEQAVAQLAADVCYDRFMEAADARSNLQALKKESEYQRDGFIEDGGWTTLANREDPVDGAADLCADRLAEAELPAAAEGANTTMADAEDTTPAESDPATGSETTAN